MSRYRREKEANLERLGLNKKHLYDLAKKNQLHISASLGYADYRYNKTRVDQLYQIYQIANDIHEVDIYLYNMSDGLGPQDWCPVIIIRFEDIDISNGSKSHNIKNLFIVVTLTLSGGELVPAQVKGFRTTLTAAEQTSNYLHSHLNTARLSGDSINLRNIGNFCLGADHLSTILMDFQAGDYSTHGNYENTLSYFFALLHTLATHESSAGGPYIYIRNIFYRDGRRLANPSSNIHRQFYNEFKEKCAAKIAMFKQTGNIEYLPDVNIVYQNRYIISDDEKFEDLLLEIADDLSNQNVKRHIYCHKDSSDTYYQWGSMGSSNTRLNIKDDFPFIFKGELIPQEVIQEEREEDQTKLYIHPNTKNYVKSKLEYTINEKLITKSAIDRYKNKSTDVQGHLQEDTVLVQEDI